MALYLGSAGVNRNPREKANFKPSLRAGEVARMRARDAKQSSEPGEGWIASSQGLLAMTV
jgi:hypothetical protein